MKGRLLVSQRARGFWAGLALAAVAFAVGCGGSQPTTSPWTAATPSSAAAATVAPTASSGEAADDAGLIPPAGATPLPAPKPTPVARTGKVWPFHGWDHAEAVTFNQFPMRPNTQLHAYDDNGWSPHLVERKPINDAQAKTAVELVTRTEGDVDVSKCPFPRHAVVLLEGTVPVASINICFSCGDIMVWPRWEPEQDRNMTDRQMKESLVRSAKQMKLYEKVFPSWKAFFRGEIGFPIDATYH